jgi:hypothetical protein
MYQQLQQSPIPKIQEGLFALEKFNRSLGTTMPKDFLQTVGPEYAIAIRWENGSSLPELFFALEVGDKANAGAALDKMWKLARAATTNSIVPESVRDLFAETTHGKDTIRSMRVPVPNVPLSPSYVVSDRFFLLTLQTDTAKALLSKLETNGKTLADNPAYQQAMQMLPLGAHSYSYLDTKGLFEQAFSQAAPRLQEHASELGAWSEFLNVKKLPTTRTISQHLQTSAAAQVVDKDGFTTVIVSPVGMPGVVVGGMIGAGVAIAQQFPNFPMR